MSHVTIGFAMSGSFCTFEKAISQMKLLKEAEYEILPIMSFNAFELDTKFGKAKDFRKTVENICQKPIIHTIADAEPIGPQKMADIMLVAPCTGNTLAKISHAITDTPVTMAVKSHLRVRRPVVICLASNDALGASAQNVGKALNLKNIYFIPISQDDPANKPASLVAHFDMIPKTLEFALHGKQIQPIFLQKMFK